VEKCSIRSLGRPSIRIGTDLSLHRHVRCRLTADSESAGNRLPSASQDVSQQHWLVWRASSLRGNSSVMSGGGPVAQEEPCGFIHKADSASLLSFLFNQ
jgi:hypothetical protein